MVFENILVIHSGDSRLLLKDFKDGASVSFLLSLNCDLAQIHEWCKNLKHPLRTAFGSFKL